MPSGVITKGEISSRRIESFFAQLGGRKGGREGEEGNTDKAHREANPKADAARGASRES